MEHCIVDGKRCSKCCEVLTINMGSNGKKWMEYARRVDFDTFEPEKGQDKKEYQLYWMIKKITKRKAKKINPYLVSVISNRQQYFTCKHLISSGCSNYENRPKICSQYPYYGKTESEFLESEENKKGGLYTPDCTFYIELK